MKHRVKILKINQITHDVRSFEVEKPDAYSFEPGQAVMVAIDKKGWEDERHPFTFTSLNEDSNLEFVIKTYPKEVNPSHSGMTEELHKLKVGDYLVIGEPMGAISYKGPGIFIAGGAGITPFIAIFRQLAKSGTLKGNKLYYSNKTTNDVILEKELRGYFGDDLHLMFSREKSNKGDYGRIDDDYLQRHIKDFSQHFYLCGPRPMVKDMQKILKKLGAKSDSLVFEG